MDSCAFCGVIISIESSAYTMALNTYNTLAPYMYSMLSAISGIAFLTMFGQAIFKGQWDWWEFGEKIVGVSVATAMLFDSNLYVTYVYDVCRQFIFGVAGLMLGAPPTSEAGFWSMVLGMEENVRRIMGVASQLWDGAGTFDIFAIFAGVALVVPVWIITLMFAIFILKSFVMLIVPLALGPILVVAATFRSTRKIAIGGLDLMIASGATIIIATLLMTLTSGTMANMISSFPAPAPSTSWIPPIFTGANQWGDFVRSQEFWSFVLMSWLCVLFMWMVPQLVAFFSDKIQAMAGAGIRGMRMPARGSPPPGS